MERRHKGIRTALLGHVHSEVDAARARRAPATAGDTIERLTLQLTAAADSHALLAGPPRHTLQPVSCLMLSLYCYFDFCECSYVCGPRRPLAEAAARGSNRRPERPRLGSRLAGAERTNGPPAPTLGARCHLKAGALHLPPSLPLSLSH